jgi:hypothetical protein
MQLTPGNSLRSDTTSFRRASNSATIAPTDSCGPVSASMAANCAGALTQDHALTASLRALL